MRSVFAMTPAMTRTALLLACPLLLAACQSPADPADRAPVFDGIAADETVYFTGNEPFWGGESGAGQLTYTTPENIEGSTFPVTRFAGNSGIGISGELDGQPFDMTVTQGNCSDTMSDTDYPFTATLRIGEEQRQGCAWTNRQPRTGLEQGQ